MIKRTQFDVTAKNRVPIVGFLCQIMNFQNELVNLFFFPSPTFSPRKNSLHEIVYIKGTKKQAIPNNINERKKMEIQFQR